MPPEIVHEKEITWMWKLVRIRYWIEDRKCDETIGKYKNFITVKVLHKEWRWTYRTNHLHDNQPYTDLS